MHATRILNAVTWLALVGCSGQGDPSGSGPASQGPAFPNTAWRLGSATGDLVLVAESTKDAIAVLDADKRRWLGSIPVGQNPVEVDGPIGLAIDRGNEFLYVLLSEPDELNPPPGSHVHPASRASYVEKLSRSDLHVLGEVRLDPDPVAMALSEDGGRLVVTHSNGQQMQTAATMSVIETSKVQVIDSAEPARIPTCSSAGGIALSPPEGRVAYVACEEDDSLAIVDTIDHAASTQMVVLSAAPATGTPASALVSRSVAMAPSGDELTIVDGAAVYTVNLETPPVVGKHWPLSGAYSSVWSLDGSKVAVVTRDPDGISILDAATGAALASRAFDPSECEKPAAVALGAEDVYVLCTAAPTGSLVALDGSAPDLAIRETYTLDGYSEALLVLPP
jgi:DNA-binding beta-propeller fold protein YncE